MTAIHQERRRFPRVPLERSCKVFHRPSLRYMRATTRNVSDEGALVEVESHRAIFAGDEMDVMVDWHGRPLLPADAMVRATVMRAEPGREGKRHIAIRFDRLIELKSVA